MKKNLLFMLLLVAALFVAVSVTPVTPVQAGAVALCHLPPGNPENVQLIYIGAPAVPAHLANHEGDHVATELELHEGSCLI